MVWMFFCKYMHSLGLLAYMPTYMFSVTVIGILLFIPSLNFMRMGKLDSNMC